jgi:dephospho-CoA kinase
MITLKNAYQRLSKDERLYNLERPIIGLTGGIATGKSTVSKMLQEKGLQVIDADALVKSIYQTEEAKNFIKQEFPTAWDGGINFTILRSMAFQDSNIKKRIEDFIYARLPEEFKRAAEKINLQNFIIYDVPLLFEKKLDKKFDLTVVVFAPREIQRKRILSRDGSSEEVIKRILEQQIDIEDKKKKADFIIDNSKGTEDLKAGVEKLLLSILE